MAWSRLQSNSASVASGNPGAAYTLNLTSGSKLIALVSLSSSQATNVTLGTQASVSDGTNTFTFLGGVDNSTFGYVGVYALDCPAGDAGTKPTITATINGAINNFGCVLLIQEVSGLLSGNTTAMLDGATVATNSGSSTGPATTAAYSSTAANEYLVACYGDPGNSITLTTPAGYSADAKNDTSDSNSEAAIFFKNSSNGAESASITLSATAQWSTLLTAFKLAAAGGAPAIVPRAARRTPYRTPALPPERRGRVTFVVPAQLNPPYPFAEIAQHRQTWPRGMPRRGRVTFVVPKQLNPPYPWAEISQHRNTWPKAWPRRGRVVTPVPPQLNPPYLFTEIRQWRQPRGFFPRRGHGFTPVPAQQAATPNPAITFQQARHPRVLFQRRGHVFTPVPGQHHPVTPVAPKRVQPRGLPRRGHQFAPVPVQDGPLAEVAPHRVQPRGLPRRGRQAFPVPAQVTVAPPAWVQGHRSPLRAIALIRRRFRQLLPWPQATVPLVDQGSVTITLTAATVTIARTTASVAIATDSDGTVSIAQAAQSVSITSNPAGSVTIGRTP